jgi:hypothetical protein
MNNIEHLIVARQPIVYASPRPTVVYGGNPVVYTQPSTVYTQPATVYTSSNSYAGLFIFFFIILFIMIIFFFTPVIYV